MLSLLGALSVACSVVFVLNIPSVIIALDWDEADEGNINIATSAMNYASCAPRTLCGPSSFTFYLHNRVYNPIANGNHQDFNSVYGLPPNITWPNPRSFGVTSTFEDPITVGPANTSDRIGVAQGFAQLDSKVDYTLFHIFTANITKGDYKGTIDIFGQIHESDPIRYLSVIGGTGDFLGARGLAACRLITIDRTPPGKWTLSFDLDLYY